MFHSELLGNPYDYDKHSQKARGKDTHPGPYFAAMHHAQNDLTKRRTDATRIIEVTRNLLGYANKNIREHDTWLSNLKPEDRQRWGTAETALKHYSEAKMAHSKTPRTEATREAWIKEMKRLSDHLDGAHKTRTGNQKNQWCRSCPRQSKKSFSPLFGCEKASPISTRRSIG